MRWYSITYDLPQHCYDGLPHGIRVLAWGLTDAKERADKVLSYLCFQYDHETIKVRLPSSKATLSEIELIADLYDNADRAWAERGRYQQTGAEYKEAMSHIDRLLRRG